MNGIHYGDITSAVDRVRAILNGDRPPQAEVFAYLHSELDFDHQVNAYADIIENCKKRNRLQFSSERQTTTSLFTLAPWCYIDGKRIYHDFRGTFESADLIADVIQERNSISFADAEKAGVTNEVWESWIVKSWIVPINNP